MLDFLAPIWNLVIYNPMLNVILLLYSIIPNYGLAIILFTLAIGILTTPLRLTSQRAMREQQVKQAALKPKLDELKKKYKDNPQQLQQAQMKLYQEEGMINPLNAGCLLQFLIFPIFIALYELITAVMGGTPEQLLQLSSHLYPFWPQLAKLVPVNPYFLGLNLAAVPSAAYGFVHPITILLIVLVVGTQWIYQKMTMPPAAQLDPQQAQMNQTMQIMPLMFGYFAAIVPIGVALYYITNSVVGIGQQFIVNGGHFRMVVAPKNVKPAKSSALSETSAASSNGSGDGKAVPAPTMAKSNSLSPSAAKQNGGDGRTKPVATANTSSGSKKGKKKRGKKS
jgi:YidC/Oxa1 family membrane protein insertase